MGDIGARRASPARTTTSRPSPSCSAWPRRSSASRAAACGCCCSRPARRSPSARGCTRSSPATATSSRTEHRVRLPRVPRRPDPDRPRGRGHAAHAQLRPRRCARTSPPPLRAAGVEITRGLQTVVATDALAALRDGYRAATLAALDVTKLPLNYHWPNDAPEHLHWSTIEDALAVCVQPCARSQRGVAASGPRKARHGRAHGTSAQGATDASSLREARARRSRGSGRRGLRGARLLEPAFGHEAVGEQQHVLFAGARKPLSVWGA